MSQTGDYKTSEKHIPVQDIEKQQIAPELYPYGSRGPVGAHYLAAKYNVRWGDMASDEERDG